MPKHIDLLPLRVLAWRLRRLAAAVAAFGALLLLIRFLDGPTQSVVVTAHPLPAGTVLTGADLATVEAPPHLVPSGAEAEVAALLGQQLVVDAPQGLPLVPGLLVSGRFGLSPPTGTVTVPVHLPEPVAAVLRPGDRVDLVTATEWPEVGEPVLLAAAALVLEVRRPETAGSLLVPASAEPVTLVAVSPEEGRRLAAAVGTLGAVLV